MEKLNVYISAHEIMASILLVLMFAERTVGAMLFVATSLVLLAELALELQAL